MGLLAPLAALLGLEASSLAARAKSMAVLYGLMATFSTLAVGFLIAAGFMALADALTPILAALILAGVFFVLTLIVYISMAIGEARRERESAERRRAGESSAFFTSAALTALPMLARSPNLWHFGLPAAAIAAFALFRSKDPD